MRGFFDGSSFLCLIYLLAGWALLLAQAASSSSSSSQSQSLLRGDRSLQSRAVRTDLIRLIPFQVQIAVRDELIEGESTVIGETLYAGGTEGGTLITDTIVDWMIASFVTMTTDEGSEQLLLNNYTTFDSIALELVDDSSSAGTIDGQELNLVQISFEGVSLWERQGTGTPPMEQEIVELIQRATFLDDRSLKASLQTAINNLLFDLGIDSVDGVPPVSIVEVRAYIVPPGSIGGGGQGGSEGGNNDTPGSRSSNENLEIIIIVAIVVACLAFALLVFAVVWAWRSDRRDNGENKPSTTPSSSSSRKQKKAKPAKPKPDPSMNGGKKGGRLANALPKRNNAGSTYQPAPEEPDTSVEHQASSYDLPNNGSNGSFPKMIGNTVNNGNDSSLGGNSGYPEDSVVSEDISSSLTAYYKSGMGYTGSRASGSGRPSSNQFNDAASMSSMDSYGYSLDGYAPSLGPTQGGYPVGPMQAARDAPMPVDGDNDDDVLNIKQLQDDESVEDYGVDPIP